MDLISVIVPIYKVEKYLDRCVESLIHQTYQNLEIILVDDGSPDRCGAMCEEWAQKDTRIRVIHKKNGGLSDARNAGMEVAQGQYIGFIDSDDWVETDMYQKLYQEMKETDSDIVSGGVRRVYEDQTPSNMLTHSNVRVVFTREEAMESLINETALVVPVWNKLYARHVVEGVLFPVGKINEDEFWSWRVIARANRIAVIPDAFYNYLQRGGSIMSQQVWKQPMHAIEAKCQRHEYLMQHIPTLKNVSAFNLAFVCLHRAQVLMQQENSENKAYIRQIQAVVQKYRPDQSYLRTLSVKQRVRYEMIRRNFMLVCKVQNWLKVGI